MTIQNINDGDLASVAFGNINDLIDAFNSLDTSTIGLFSLSNDGMLLWNGEPVSDPISSYAYSKALDAGFVGTPQQWVDTLQDLYSVTSVDNGRVLSNDGVNVRWVVLNKSSVGLNNVDNTSDLSKPISVAMQNALNLKLNITDFQNQLDASTIDQGDIE